MTVKELMDQLSAFNPTAEVVSWCNDQNGEVLDDAGAVEITGVAHWRRGRSDAS